jgi:hypothetical protein
MPWSVYNSTGKLLQSLAIGDDSIVEGKLDVSNAPTNGYYLQAQSGEGGGLTWAAAGGIASVVADTTPQLGGNLDMQANLLVGNGGSTGIAISANGEVTMAAQPCVLAFNSASDTNITGASGPWATVDFDTEVFDQNADFASDTFTAPITGRYLVDAMVNYSGITTAATMVGIMVVASNRSCDTYWSFSSFTAPAILLAKTIIVDMDASDTVLIQVYGNGESSDVHDVTGGSTPRTHFSMTLVA